MFGVQSKKNLIKDTQETNIWVFVITGIIITLILVIILSIIANFVVK